MNDETQEPDGYRLWGKALATLELVCQDLITKEEILKITSKINQEMEIKK